MSDDTLIEQERGVLDVVKRIDLLKSNQKLSFEEKVQIAELVLSILKEEKSKPVVQ